MIWHNILLGMALAASQSASFYSLDGHWLCVTRGLKVMVNTKRGEGAYVYLVGGV